MQISLIAPRLEILHLKQSYRQMGGGEKNQFNSY